MKFQFSTKLLLAGALFITFLSYTPSLFNGFTTWDDDQHVTENPQVLSFSAKNWKEVFTSTVNKTYIPLTTLSFAVEHRFFGLNPFVYHLNNLLLHLAVTACVFILAIQIGLNPYAAFWASAIFGIHPMHVESVAWITERKDVLYALFYLASIMSYLRYVEGKRWGFYVLSLGCAVASILAKPMALSLPLILFLFDWVKARKDFWRCLWEKIPYFAAVVPIAWITYSLNARVVENPLGAKALTWLWSFAFYIEKFFVPVPLVPLYDLPKPVALSNPAYIQAIVIAAIIVVLISRRIKWFSFAIGYYFLSIFFLLRFDHKMDVTLVADRFMYLPSFGVCLFLGWGIAQMLAKGKEARASWYQPLRVGVIAILLVLGFLTFRQTKIWHNDIVLFTKAIKYNPHNPFAAYAYYNRGRAYELQGKPELAFTDYNQAIKIMPKHFDARNNRANLFQGMGKLDAAIADINEAIRFKPDYAKGHNNKANILTDMGKLEEALQSYNKALELNPKFWQAFNNRGLLLLKLGRFEQAAEDFTRSIELNSVIAEIYNNRGIAYIRSSRVKECLADFDYAIQLDPRYAEAFYNRGYIYEQLREYEKAKGDYQSAVQLKPDYTQALIRLNNLKHSGQ